MSGEIGVRRCRKETALVAALSVEEIIGDPDSGNVIGIFYVDEMNWTPRAIWYSPVLWHPKLVTTAAGSSESGDQSIPTNLQTTMRIR
jgi:hypothetical protein